MLQGKLSQTLVRAQAICINVQLAALPRRAVARRGKDPHISLMVRRSGHILGRF
jgi:hypothetical protein